ncbi:hypothetical protein I204_00126 [Kwoniella mangroviensis CBS 8886]|nr:hypothetical protein I204_00126 [Kwoniella mangroviensis CBS 8886]
MFAPRSTHLPRTYSVYHQPTTTRKNANKENAGALPSKTPSRAGKPMMGGGLGTGLRMGLGVKTEVRDRNVLIQHQQQQGYQGGGKGKGKEGEDIEPKRLFSHGPSKSTTSIPPSKSLSSMPHIQLTKTPAPSRKKQPSFQALRTPAPSFQEPAPTPLPSATRQRRRSRQSLSNISLTPIKASIEQSFVTPAPVQWEEELSLGSIEETTNEMLQDVREENELDDGSDGDPEYMPPPVQELPYTPAYDHPDLTSIFSTLSGLPPMWTVRDDVIMRDVPEFEFQEMIVGRLTLKDDEELEEEWLRPKSKPQLEPTQPTKPQNTSIRGITSKSSLQPKTTPRPSVTSSRLDTTTKTKPPAPVPRPPPIRQRTTISTGSRSAQSRQASLHPAQKAAQPVKPIKISEEDQKLFESWEKEDVPLGDFELNLDMDFVDGDLNFGALKLSDYESSSQSRQ